MHRQHRECGASWHNLFCIVLFLLSAVNCLNIQVTLTGMSTTTSPSMRVLAVRAASVAHPTGDPNFSVMQGFPEPFSAQESDPFLMCDVFGPTPSKGVQTDPDRFDVGWHPHRGMDILTYITEGTGRHADSLGNRETFASPGMQWISVGSGIEHAEGGGTPAGQSLQGFQIWVNVPSERKMDDPKYGTEPPENIPTLSFPSAVDGEATVARVLAGELQGNKGPFRTVQDVQIIDYSLPSVGEVEHNVPEHMDNCLVYVFQGSAEIADQVVGTHHVVRLDAQPGAPRSFTIRSASGQGARLLVFAGKRLNQPIAWHGPFVMTTQAEIQQTLREYREGTFLKKRAVWDYKRLASKPAIEK